MSDMSHLAVVITGASSGVGRATAHAFARHGARLALTARAAGPLEEAAHECEELGARAIVVPADVTDPSAMRRLADAAAREFGGLDVWVNNAGLGVVGRFHEVPIEAHWRTIETNLLGYMNGSHAALAHFVCQPASNIGSDAILMEFERQVTLVSQKEATQWARLSDRRCSFLVALLSTRPSAMTQRR
jgi:NADP-dependent 3-hydroxy acid dehydrogenase YdfG